MRLALLLLAALFVAAPPARAALQGAPGAPRAEDRPIVRDLVVNGLEAHDPVRIAQRLGIVVGRRIPSASAVRLAEERLWDDFRILVEVGGYTFEEVEGGVRVHLTLIESPVDLDPQFVGNVNFNVDQLREWALLNDKVEVYVDEAEAITDRIRRAYLRQGYHFVEVEHVIGGEGIRKREIIFEIREGPKVYVKSVDIEGNESIATEGFLFWTQSLRKAARLGSKGPGVFAWFGHRFDEEVVEADKIAIAQEYRARGFMEVEVDAELEFLKDRSGVHIDFVVDEGPRYDVASIEILGIERETIETGAGFQPEVVERQVDLLVPQDELQELLSLKVGEPFEQSRVLIDRQRLLDRYGEEGHIEASRFEGADGGAGWRFFDPAIVYDYEAKTVQVVYLLQQGRPFRLRFLEINGNQNTKDRVIRRRFGQLPGGVLDAKKMRDGLRRVRATGYFDASLQTTGNHPPPSLKYRVVEDEPDVVDALVSVTEGNTINANLSGGVASDQGLVGILSLQIQNFDAQKLPRNALATFAEVYRKEAFTGDGETFGLQASPGSQISSYSLQYSHPDVLGRHFDPIGMYAELRDRDRIFRSHDEGRTSAQFNLTRAFGQGDFQASLGVRWQEITTDDLDDPEDIPRTLGRTPEEQTFVGLLGSFSANKLDSRRLPRSGWTARWSNTYYSEAFGGDVEMFKSELSYDRYFHLSDDPLTAAPGIYIGLGTGVAVPIGDQKGSVNYGERFFFGGTRFLRGFRFRGVGPNEGDYPLGGETYARATVEYRMPLYTQSIPGTARRRELFRGSIFVDAGILDPAAWELDPEERRVTYGFALGLIDPFPITFSFGWPLEQGDGDQRQVFGFSLSLR